MVEERTTGVEDGRQTLRPLPHSLTHSLTDESAGSIDFMWPVLYMPVIHLVASHLTRTPGSSTSFSFPLSLAAPNPAMPRCASSTELRCNAPVILALPRGHAAARTHLHSASALDLHPLPILCEVAWLKQVNTFSIVHKLQSYSECFGCHGLPDLVSSDARIRRRG